MRQGKLRIAQKTISTTDYAVILKAEANTLSADRKVYAKDASGSLIIRGYHVTYGTTVFIAKSNYGANDVGESTITLTGALTTSIILVSAASSAEVASVVPFGATCATADQATVLYQIGVATAAVSTIVINYAILNPQTS